MSPYCTRLGASEKRRRSSTSRRVKHTFALKQDPYFANFQIKSSCRRSHDSLFYHRPEVVTIFSFYPPSRSYFACVVQQCCYVYHIRNDPGFNRRLPKPVVVKPPKENNLPIPKCSFNAGIFTRSVTYLAVNTHLTI